MNKLFIKSDEFPQLVHPCDAKFTESNITYNLILNDNNEIRISDNFSLVIKSINNCIKWFNTNLSDNKNFINSELKKFIDSDIYYDINTNNYLIENYIHWKMNNIKHNNYQIEILKKSTDYITKKSIIDMEYHDFLLEDIDFDNIYMCQIMPGIYDIFIPVLHIDHYDYIPAIYIEDKFNIRIKLNGRYIINK